MYIRCRYRQATRVHTWKLVVASSARTWEARANNAMPAKRKPIDKAFDDGILALLGPSSTEP